MGFVLAVACRSLNSVNSGNEGTSTNPQISLGVWGRNLGLRRGLASRHQAEELPVLQTALYGRLSTAVVGGGSAQLGPAGVCFIPSCGEIPIRALRCEEAKVFPFPKDSTWQVKKNQHKGAITESFLSSQCGMKWGQMRRWCSGSERRHSWDGLCQGCLRKRSPGEFLILHPEFNSPVQSNPVG